MPNRLLKESICTSDNIDQLSVEAENTFYRLIVNCDDYGRMDARPKILRARLFPLRANLTEEKLMGFMDELVAAELITIYEVDCKPYLQVRTWETHQQVRAKKSKYPSPPDIICNQVRADDYKCPRNPIQSESVSLSESESVSELTDAGAREILTEQQFLLDSAEDAGFKMSNNVRAALIALYADYGLDKLMYGLKECARHGVSNLAYLEAVLSGKKKAAKPKVIAQDFEQRDYSKENDRIVNELADEMRDFLKGGTG